MINPCKGICTLKNGQCIGCKRTEFEIMNWWDFDDDKQEEINNELENRKLNKSNNIPNRRFVRKKNNENMMKKFDEYIKENEGGGVANATLGNTGGMGNVVAPQPSSIPGDVAGSTPGSGDISAYDMGKHFGTNPFKKRKKSKKSKKKNDDYKNIYVTKFTDWIYNK